MTKMYVVTDDGWNAGWGSSIYLIGVFDNLEDAQKANGKITEVELNKTYPLKETDFMGKCVNENYLGGYVE